MTRREAISRVSLLLGGVIIGADAFISGCKPAAAPTHLNFSKAQLDLLNEIAETIIPATTTPGAKAVNAASFMLTVVKDCYEEKDQSIFAGGLNEIDKASDKKFGKSFMQLSPAQRTELLIQIDAEQQKYSTAKKENDAPHYFRAYKELTLLAYFTSEAGATMALSYVPVPGKYEAVTDYKQGQPAWALN